MPRPVLTPALALWIMALSSLPGRSAEFAAEQSGDKVTVRIGHDLFTEYLAAPKLQPALGPILWPIIGPTGKPMTRAFPMGEGPNEKKDHPHHRSLWLNHGDVNGSSFWAKEAIKHRKFVKVEGGARALVVTINDWIAADGTKVCEDERTLTFRTDGENRLIDLDVTVKATEGAVTFGDTKEGSFGVRVAETMKVDAKLGGRIINSEGKVDGAAWAQRAAWVDYHGPVDGQTVGIAVLNHPTSFRFPTYWHVRTYGLFAANPFGIHDFKGPEGDGAHTIAKGGSMSLRYRVVLHKGDEKQGRIAESYAAYAKEAK